MNESAFDGVAFAVMLVVALVIAATLLLADRGGMRRTWIAAGVLVVVLSAVGALDLARASPRETLVSTVVTGIVLAVLGSVGIVRGTRRVRRWLRWIMVPLTALVLLMAGLLVGAAFVARFLPF